MAPPRLGGECNFVHPFVRRAVVADRNAQGHTAVVEVPGRKAPDARNATPARHRILKSTTSGGDLSQEPQCVEQVRFTGCVRPDDEQPIPKVEVCLLEVAPVLQREVGQSHGRKSNRE